MRQIRIQDFDKGQLPFMGEGMIPIELDDYFSGFTEGSDNESGEFSKNPSPSLHYLLGFSDGRREKTGICMNHIPYSEIPYREWEE